MSQSVAAPTVVTTTKHARMLSFSARCTLSPGETGHQGEVGMNKVAHPVVHILDDDDEVRDVLTAVVQAAGHVALSYSRPSQFLEKLDPALPGTLILDVRLPEMSGLELQR